MRKYTSLILLALFATAFTGCSTHSPTPPETSKRPAIDLVQSGKDATFPDGVVHVAKREGNSLQGIRIVMTPPHGQKEVITADTGTIEPGVAGVNSFENQITLTLRKAKIVSGKTNSTAAVVKIVLHS